MKLKKALSVALVTAMAVTCLAGCGSGGQQSADGSSGSGETFKIGGIGPLTGAAAVYGIAVKNGAELAVKEINAAGGIGGVQIEMNYQDDEHDPEKAVNAYNTLKDWDAQIDRKSVV